MLLAPAGSFLCMKRFKTGPCGDNGGDIFLPYGRAYGRV
jgi:hypothetical protein